MTNTAAALTVTIASASFTAVYGPDALDIAKRDARTIADRGAAVSLKRISIEAAESQEMTGEIVIALAKFARDERFNNDRVISYRIITTEAGVPVVWLMIASNDKNGRGYIVHSSRTFDSMEVVSGAPTHGLYMWGFARLSKIEPIETATIAQDWTVLA